MSHARKSVRQHAEEKGLTREEETNVLLAANELFLEFLAENEEDERGRKFREAQRIERLGKLSMKGRKTVLEIAIGWDHIHQPE